MDCFMNKCMCMDVNDIFMYQFISSPLLPLSLACTDPSKTPVGGRLQGGGGAADRECGIEGRGLIVVGVKKWDIFEGGGGGIHEGHLQ